MPFSIESNDKPPKNRGGRPKGRVDKQPRKRGLPRSPGAGQAPTRAQRAIVSVAFKQRQSQTDAAYADAIARVIAEASAEEQARLQEAEHVYAARKEVARAAIDKVRDDDAARLAKATELRQACRADDLAATAIDGGTAL